MKSQYIIILTVIITLTASMLILAFIENSQRIHNQNFWSVYFVDPFGENNDFVIDNKTQKTNVFYYEITDNEKILQSGDIEIEKDKQLLINTEYNAKPIMIKVILDKKEKIIDKK